jgi:hypothetical protein
VQAPVAELNDAEVVFVGYGIEAPEYQWDDFKDVDLTGKVLLMLNNDPDWDPAMFAVGGLSEADRANLVDRRAVRTAGRQ